MLQLNICCTDKKQKYDEVLLELNSSKRKFSFLDLNTWASAPTKGAGW